MKRRRVDLRWWEIWEGFWLRGSDSFVGATNFVGALGGLNADPFFDDEGGDTGVAAVFSILSCRIMKDSFGKREEGCGRDEDAVGLEAEAFLDFCQADFTEAVVGKRASLSASEGCFVCDGGKEVTIMS